jgi:hypothetical protein
MKKLLALMLVGLMVALAAPALAEDCDVNFDVDVDKNVTIDESVLIQKYVFLFSVTFAEPDEFAEAAAYKCDENYDNYVNTWIAVNTDTIDDSFNGFEGIAQVNQAAGSLNNQGNNLAIAVTNAKPVDPNGTDGTTGLSHAQAAVDKLNYANVHYSQCDTLTDSITGSFNGFDGIAQVNQSAGYMNNQNNNAAIAANLVDTGLVALSESFLTMTNVGNSYQAFDGVRTAEITGSFNGFAGIGQVNQSPGSMNNQANNVSVAYSGAGF